MHNMDEEKTVCFYFTCKNFHDGKMLFFLIGGGKDGGGRRRRRKGEVQPFNPRVQMIYVR